MKKTYLLAILATLVLFGCKPMEVVRYVDKWHTELKIDSIYINQTDSFREYLKGDTLYRDSWKTLYKMQYKYINKVDSFVKVDTIVKVVPDTKIVKEKAFLGKFDIGLLVLIGAFLIYKLLKFLKFIP